ncbi:MAG: SpoIIE family protein phosphatase [Deltaproteobacteria bacterium]|jgi:serine phosphatase RsbU (regulator of sigma subunit)|nr:SpoIIE family protein phosphatase [Deltaproteobacteria bacterium]
MAKKAKSQNQHPDAYCISDPLAKTVLDSISAHIAILDQDGVILETNKAWQSFAKTGKAREEVDFIGINYLTVCDGSTGEDAEDARAVASGIRSVISGEIKEFAYDYPCHSPTGRHWYYMRAIRMAAEGPIRIVVSHSEITALKLAEEALVERERERDRLRHSLELAMEVQQNLLPKSMPQIKGLDIAAKSIYCDETGGDYFDFLELDESKDHKTAVVIGDVSGHGIPSALLMATARSALRQRARLPGSVSRIITDVNRQLTEDVEDSGRFVTLFFIIVDRAEKALIWVRAGHDPGILYRHRDNIFEELKGTGPALGLSPEASYEENSRRGICRGDIVVLFTDGIFEAQNLKGQMFSKERIQEIIQKNSELSAKKILNEVFTAAEQFQGKGKFDDDATMAVIKFVSDL